MLLLGDRWEAACFDDGGPALGFGELATASPADCGLDDAEICGDGEAGDCGVDGLNAWVGDEVRLLRLRRWRSSSRTLSFAGGTGAPLMFGMFNRHTLLHSLGELFVSTPKGS